MEKGQHFDSRVQILYNKQYGNQRIPANLWQFFFLRGFRKLANVLKI